MSEKIIIPMPKGNVRWWNDGWRAAQKGKKPKDCPYVKVPWDYYWDNGDYPNSNLKHEWWHQGFKSFQRHRRKALKALEKQKTADLELEMFADLAKELGYS